MQILPVCIGRDCTTFNASLRVTKAAKDVVYKEKSQDTLVFNYIFKRSMDKFQNMIFGEFPFAGDVFFDEISKNTKAAYPHTKSKYEMRIMDKVVDFDFNPRTSFHNHSKKSIEENIEHEANTQAGYLHNTYLYLRRTLGK